MPVFHKRTLAKSDLGHRMRLSGQFVQIVGYPIKRAVKDQLRSCLEKPSPSRVAHQFPGPANRHWFNQQGSASSVVAMPERSFDDGDGFAPRG
jgi:hypothetical protein